MADEMPEPPGDLYVNKWAATIPYHTHCYSDGNGNRYWTRESNHPEDPRCPGCWIEAHPRPPRPTPHVVPHPNGTKIAPEGMCPACDEYRIITP